MKAFQVMSAIIEYADFKEFAQQAQLSQDDLILTNEYIYHPAIAELNLPSQYLFQEKFGGGEPTDIMVDGILDELRNREYNRIVAVGGGTIIDIAKVLAVAGKQDKVDDLYDHMDRLTKKHPLVIVPTTCGTGSEVTNISILNRTTRGIKVGLVSPAMYADEAVLIPDMLKTLPYQVYATSSIDAMVHAVESYLSPNACHLSEMFSVEALRLLLGSWQKAVGAGGQDAWKADADIFLRASNYAGIAFGHAGCAAVHALAYPLGGSYHIPHGQSNQMMFADVMRKYLEKKPVGKINSLQRLFGDLLGVGEDRALEALCDLMDAVLKKDALHEKGIKKEDLPVFAKNVIETQQRLLHNNYVELTEEDILNIYKNAY